MKKFLAILLTLVMVLACCATMATAETATTTITVLGYERNKGENSQGFMAGRDGQVVWQAAEKMFAENGVAFEFEIIADSEQYKTTVQTRLAAAHDLPDMFYGGVVDTVTLLNLADNGTILKINEIMELTKGDAYNYWFGGEGDAARLLVSNEEGDFYWVPRIQINQLDGTNAGTSMCICIRKDWLEKLDMAIPTTLDEFTAALQAFQDNDVNGNGIKDEILLVNTNGFATGMNLWFGIPTTTSDSIGINLTEQTVSSAWYNENIDEYFAYVQKLVNDGLLSRDYIGTSTSSSAAFSGNQVAAMEYYPVGTYQEAAVIAGGCADAYYIGIEPIEAVAGTKPFVSEETPYLVYMQHCVSKNAADKLETIAAVYDTIYSAEFLDLMTWGVEGKTYEVLEDGTKKSLVGTLSTQEKFKQGLAKDDEIWRFFLPNVHHNERKLEMANKAAAGYPEKVDYEWAVHGHTPLTPNDNTSYYALATIEELEILDEYQTDLVTASQELATALSLGEIAVEDIPEQVEELKALGLDEVLAVRTAQYNRGIGK